MKRIFFIFGIISCVLIFHQDSYAQKYTFKNGNKKEYVTAKELQTYILPGLRTRMKELNEQLPMAVDECTEMYSAVVNGSVINYNYRVSFDSELLTQAEINELCDDIKKRNEENLLFLFQSNSDKMPVSEWCRLYGELGILYKYNYVDCNGRVFACVIVNPKTLLKRK